MSKKESFTPAWTEEAPGQGTYRSIFKWGDPAGFKHPNRGFYGMIKDVFEMTDDDFGQPQEQGNETVECGQPIRLSDEQIRAFEGIVGKENVHSDDYSRVKYGAGKTMEEAMKLRKGIVESAPDLVLHPRNKEDVQKIVAYCERAGNPDLPLRRGLFRDLRVSVRQGRGLPGDEHPHASRPGIQRDEPDDHRGTRHPGAGVREDAERRPRSVQGKAEIHGRPFPAVLRILLGGRLDRGARVRPAVLLLRRHVRHRAQPGIRDACRILQDPGLSRHRNRAEGQRHHEGERGDVRCPRECHLEAVQAPAREPAAISATCSPPGRRRWTPRGRSRKGNSACPGCSAFRTRKRPTWG